MVTALDVSEHSSGAGTGGSPFGATHRIMAENPPGSGGVNGCRQECQRFNGRDVRRYLGVIRGIIERWLTR